MPPLQCVCLTLNNKKMRMHVIYMFACNLTHKLCVLLASPFLAVFSRCGTSEKKYMLRSSDTYGFIVMCGMESR